jgi:hypothetical protein
MKALQWLLVAIAVTLTGAPAQSHPGSSGGVAGIGALLSAPLAMYPSAGAAAAAAAVPAVQIVRVPDGGLQPQVATDGHGAVSLVYFSGAARNGNAWYSRSVDGGRSFSPPLRVNSLTGSVMAVGYVRGPRLAVEPNGTVHVAWANANQPGVAYARLPERGAQFTPQANLETVSLNADGPSVAADGRGGVYVAWHGLAPGGPKDEQHRRLWVARSRNGGRSFGRETAASPPRLGACSCCGTAAVAEGNGTVDLLYRAAQTETERDIYLLTSRNRGRSFEASDSGPWALNYCPLTNSKLLRDHRRVLAAWEQQGQVRFAFIAPGASRAEIPIEPPGNPLDRKYPAIAANASGDILLAWTEGVGWAHGGAVAWQMFDGEGHPLGAEGRAAGVPAWDFPAVFARPDGSFVLMY